MDELPDHTRPATATQRRTRSAEVLPDTSFVDRYRGTEWDNLPPVPPVETAPRKTRWRPRTWIWLLAGAALLSVGVAGGVYIAFGSQKTTPLGAFVHMTPPPTAVVIGPSATPDPAAVPTPSSSPTSTPAIWLVDASHPAGLFIANMTAVDASYHLDLSTTMTAAGQHVYVAESADASGSDFSIEMSLTSLAKTTQIAVIYKAGYGYAKLDDGSWIRRELTAPGINVMGKADAYAWDQLQYVGPETLNGTLLYHVRVPINGWPSDPELLTALEVSIAPPTYTWDVWVDDAGRPVRGAIHATLSMKIEGQDLQVAMDSDYAWSKFGQKIKIVAPSHYRHG